MPRCCGGASCSCVIEEGVHIQVLGTGQPTDPFVLSADVDMEVTDNSVFNLTLSGLGTSAVPWDLAVGFAPTATLNDLPDVNTPTPTNGQVIGWDSATSQWTARAPTTAASGSVQHDTSLAGDGSAGTPLQINEDPARMLGTTSSGLGLSDTGMNSVVRRFSDSTARAAASPAPVTNALSILGSAPGQIDYWTGSLWAAASQFLLSMSGEEMYAISGPYTGTQRLTLVSNYIDTMTDTDGVFDAIPSATLAGKAGVVTAWAQASWPGGPSSITVPYTIMLSPDAGAIRGVAFRLDDGQPMTQSVVRCTVTAFVY